MVFSSERGRPLRYFYDDTTFHQVSEDEVAAAGSRENQQGGEHRLTDAPGHCCDTAEDQPSEVS